MPPNPQYTTLYLGSQATVSDGLWKYNASELDFSGSLLKNLAMAVDNSSPVPLQQLTDAATTLQNQISAITNNVHTLNNFKNLQTYVDNLNAQEQQDLTAQINSLTTMIDRDTITTVQCLPIPSIYADESPPMPIPTNLLSTIPADGWYYSNVSTNSRNKINWYFPVAKGMTYSSITGIYASIDLFSSASIPYIVVYSWPKTGGAASWYGGKHVFDVSYSSMPGTGQQLLVANLNSPNNNYVNNVYNSPIYNLEKSTSFSAGTILPTDTVQFISFSTNSAATAEQVKFLLNHLTIVTSTGTIENMFSNAEVQALVDEANIATINSTLNGYASSFTTAKLSTPLLEMSGNSIQASTMSNNLRITSAAGDITFVLAAGKSVSFNSLKARDGTTISLSSDLNFGNAYSIKSLLPAVDASDAVILSQLTTETSRATAAESSLANSINAEILRASTKEDALQVSVDTINSTISPYPTLFSTELLAASGIKSQLSYSDLLLPDTIGDISYYPPNQLVLLETLDINPTVDPETNKFVGWYVCGNGIPTGTTILNYRYDYTNYSSVGRAIYANLSNDIGEPSGTYTICVAMKVKSDIDFQNAFSCLNITDAVHPQDAAAFHQIADAVTIEKIRAEAIETNLQTQITAANTLLQQLNTWALAVNGALYNQNNNLTPPTYELKQ